MYSKRRIRLEGGGTELDTEHCLVISFPSWITPFDESRVMRCLLKREVLKESLSDIQYCHNITDARKLPMLES